MAILLILTPSSIAGPLSKDLAAELTQKMPTVKVLASESCGIGSRAFPATGLLVEQKEKNSHPLKLMIAFKQANTWNLKVLSSVVEYSKGAAGNILQDYWGPKGYTGGFSIRCTVPELDPDIKSEANGAFVNGVEKTDLKKKKHLCFSISAVYNSWACYSLASVNKDPILAFVQMNAD